MNDDASYRLNREMEAAKLLRADLADLMRDDPEFMRETVEAETSLFECLDALVLSIKEDDAICDGIDSLLKDFVARKNRIAHRCHFKRTLVAKAMEIGEVRKRETPAGTVSLKALPASAIVLEEADIPTKFWKPQAPKLDLKAVTAALRARAAGLALIGQAPEQNREIMRAELDDACPEIPGATLGNGGTTIAIRT